MSQDAISKPLVLIILDGWGFREDSKDNGIAKARTPFFDELWATRPRSLVDGSGPAVGLPQGIMGNSEVGHMNLGAGRVVYSGLSQIYQAIENKDFFKNEALLSATEQVQNAGSTLHLMGLLSDGAVHSHQDHLYALLKLAKDNGISHVAVHCFLDGRDTSPQDGIKYLEQLQDQMAKIGVGEIASVGGRFFAMDRDKRWERVQEGFAAVVGSACNQTEDVLSYVRTSYKNGEGDEFVKPVVVTRGGEPVAKMQADDALIFFNFRADRAREISWALTDPDFQDFDRKDQALPAQFVCMALYDQNLQSPVAFPPTFPQEIFGEVLAEQGITQLRIAETEKYAHVTFFFNGGRDVVFEGEDRVLIPSPKEVATYDLKPEMSAFLVKDELINRVESGQYSVVICNFANSDMVGHTAVQPAIIKAVETLDQCLSEVVPAVLKQGGALLITADHGNAEQMVDDKGEPHTAHTTNLVPLIFISDTHEGVELKSGGRLCDIAPTMLDLLNIPKPKAMTGESLIRS